MPYVAIGLVAVVGILFLQATDAIPVASVGGPMVIALVSVIATLVVGIYEAWENKRRILGWLLNIVVVLLGVVILAPFGGMVVALLLSPFMSGSGSLAAQGGPLMSISLAVMMCITIAIAWGSLWAVNRWRDRSRAAG